MSSKKHKREIRSEGHMFEMLNTEINEAKLNLDLMVNLREALFNTREAARVAEARTKQREEMIELVWRRLKEHVPTEYDHIRDSSDFSQLIIDTCTLLRLRENREKEKKDAEHSEAGV